MTKPSPHSGIGKVRNPFTGRYGRLVNADSQLGELQAETNKLTQYADRQTGEIAATTVAFIAEMTGVMETILKRLDELVEQQTDPDGIRAIAKLADRLANQRGSQRPKRPVGFIPPSAGGSDGGAGNPKLFDQDADPDDQLEIGENGLPVGTHPWDDPEGALMTTWQPPRRRSKWGTPGYTRKWWAGATAIITLPLVAAAAIAARWGW